MPLTMMFSFVRNMAELRRDADLLQQPTQHFVRIEVSFGNLAGRLAVRFVIASNRFGPGHGLVERAERHQAFTRRQMTAEARVLHKNRLARGQIPDTAIAEPSAVRIHVDALSHGELSIGLLHIAPKGGRVSGDFARIGELPTVLLQRDTILVVRRVNVEGNFERR